MGKMKNKSKKQHLDDSEFIQVFEVEVDNLMEFINNTINNDNFACCTQLYNFV